VQLINQLTGLRFIAALGVVLCHFARPIQIPNSLLFLTDFFGSFVNLFFILSGFVLTLNYSHLNRPTNRDGYIKYAVSRLGRILPVYWLSLMAMAWLYIVFGFPPLKNDSVDWTMSFIANFFAIQSWVPSLFIQQSWNAPGWSISSEIFFYTSLPLLLKSKVIDGTDKGWIRIWSVLAILLTIYWLAIWLFLKGDTYDKNFLLAFPIRLPLFGIFCFAFGVNLGKSYLQDAPKYIERRGSIKLLITTIFILIVSWLCF
jgi:peptidoglycan/LPS O-acetylase OafA/YrhL